MFTLVRFQQLIKSSNAAFPSESYAVSVTLDVSQQPIGTLSGHVLESTLQLLTNSLKQFPLTSIYGSEVHWLKSSWTEFRLRLVYSIPISKSISPVTLSPLPLPIVVIEWMSMLLLWSLFYSKADVTTHFFI